MSLTLPASVDALTRSEPSSVPCTVPASDSIVKLPVTPATFTVPASALTVTASSRGTSIR